MTPLDGPVFRPPADLFTDRSLEAQAFREALRRHATALHGEVPPRSRENVLVFWGQGGVGKSALTRRLRAWMDRELPLESGWGAVPDVRAAGSARVDVRSSGGHLDLPRVLFELRSALTAIKPRWPAFDLAFSAYWSAYDPQRSFPVDNAQLRETSSALLDSLADVASTVMDDLDLPGLPVGAILTLSREIGERVRSRGERRSALSTHPDFAQVLDDTQNMDRGDLRPDIAVRLVRLLSTELLQRPDRPVTVFFFDHVERLAVDPRREGERHLSEIIWAMPSSLFVLVSRNRLTWHRDDAVGIRLRGPAAWPGLHGGARDQLQVGILSDEDARRVLEAARLAYGLDMSDELIDRLTVTSGGICKHLELIVERAQMIAELEERPIDIDDVGGTFDELVAHILDDIPLDEQSALRAAALMRKFDAELLARAAEVTLGAAIRATDRPMIERAPRQVLPFELHDEVRRAIRAASPGVPGGWSDSDWVDAGDRTLDEARRRYEEASESDNGPAALEALGIAISLVCEIDVRPGPSPAKGYRDWLSRALVYAPSIVGVVPLIPAVSKTEYGAMVLDFINGKDREVPLDERLRRLRTVFDSTHPLELVAGRHLGYAYRNLSRWSESEGVFDELVRRSPTQVNLFQRAYTTATSRRFSRALEQTEGLRPERVNRLRAHLDLTHGLPADWLRQSAAKLTKLREGRRNREYLEEFGSYLRWRLIADTAIDADAYRDLLRGSQEVGHSIGTREALTCLALAAPWSEEAATIEERLVRLDRKANNGELGVRSATVMVLRAYVNGERSRLDQAAESFGYRRYARDRSWIPIERLLASIGIEVSGSEAEWQAPLDAVTTRWSDIFERYRKGVLATQWES